MTQSNDVRVLRELARQVAEIAAKPVQDERRDLWRRHNSLERTRIPVINLGMPFRREVYDREPLQCEDLFFRAHEDSLRQIVMQDQLDDDTVIEPWINVKAVFKRPAEDRMRWGVPIQMHRTGDVGGAGKIDPPLQTEDDLAKLIGPTHEIDDQASQAQFRKMQDAVGDLVTVNLDPGSYWRGWRGDISTDIVQLRGLDQFMLDMMDRPAWLHRLLAFMRDGILRAHEQAEQAGHWRLAHHNNQAVPYCKELADPSADPRPVARKDLWGFFASQETTLVSPAMFDEFMLQYQLPIIKPYGLTAYGCCEDLTRKISLLKKIPNLRRISVTPWADVARCAEQIGTDYVFSWRPSPAEAICRGYDPKRLRKLIREGLSACRGCVVDITFKDLETIAGSVANLADCIRVTRETAAEFA